MTSEAPIRLTYREFCKSLHTEFPELIRALTGRDNYRFRARDIQGRDIMVEVLSIHEIRTIAEIYQIKGNLDAVDFFTNDHCDILGTLYRSVRENPELLELYLL